MIALAPMSRKLMTYNEALMFCAFCNHDGYTDWRMPTGDEHAHCFDVIGWHLLDPEYADGLTYTSVVVPVRDI